MMFRNSRAAAVLATTAIAGLALIGLPATAAFAATGSVENPTISVVSDGNSTTSPVIDDDANNGIVGTNDSVCFSWSFGSAGLTDGVFSQTLPSGWSWTTDSLITLASNSDLYTSSYAMTGSVATGQTLTATISVPDGSTIVTLGPLCAIPSGSSTPGGYTPTLEVADGSGAIETTAPDVTVVGTPKADLYKALSSPPSFAQHDFGAGPVDAVYIDFTITVRRPIGNPSYGALDPVIPSPFTISDSYTVSPAAATTDIQLLNPSSGTVALAGSDIIVTGATGVGSAANWAVVERMWFLPSELPTAQSTPGFATVTNTAALEVPGVADEDTSNNTAVGPIQGWKTDPGPGVGVGYTGKELYAANSATPTFNVDPYVGNNRSVTNSIVSTNSIVFARYYMGLRNSVTGGSVNQTNSVSYDFWNPTQQQIYGNDSNIFVGDDQGAQLAASQFAVSYTTADGSGATDPATLSWFPRSSPLFDPTTVRGIRIRYIGSGAPDPTWTTDWLLFGVPFHVVAGSGAILPDTAKFTTDGVILNQQTRFMIVSSNYLSLTKTVSATSVTSGSSLGYTLNPNVDRAPGANVSSAVTGLKVTDTLPPTIVSVDTSGVDPAWSVTTTPGNPGPDGIPGTSDDISGITLVFTYRAGTATTETVLPSIAFGATTSVVKPASGTIVNFAVISADNNVQDLSARTASATTVVGQANVLAKSKVADYPEIEVRDPQVAWTSSWFNFQGSAQGLSYFVDVLPYNGDGRGTSFTGTAALATATILGSGAASNVLEYTTDAPATVSSAPASGTTWIAAPAGGDFTALSGVTALRVTLPTFPNGEAGVGGLNVAMNVVGQSDGDVYANTITGRVNVDLSNPSAGKAFPAGPPVTIDVVASDVSGLVWYDANGNGIDDGESGIGGVLLSLVDGAGTPVYQLDGVTPVTTLSLADGTYAFLNYHSGDYRVVATPPAGAVNTYDLDGTLDSDSGEIVVPYASAVPDVNFGYQLVGSLAVNKMIVGPGAQAFGAGPFVFSVVCTLDGSQVVNQNVSITFAPGEDNLNSDAIQNIPLGSSCLVTEIDNGSADATPAPVTVEITHNKLGNFHAATFTNTFSLATLNVSKIVDGSGADEDFVTQLTFEILVTCQVESTDPEGSAVLNTVYSGTVALGAGETVEVLDADGSPVALPFGTHCFGEETDNGGAIRSVVDFDSYDSAAVVAAGNDAQVLTITATNTFDTAVSPEFPTTPTVPGLAFTGLDLQGNLILGGVTVGAALVLGVLLLLIARRRRREG